jgi:hypothetical protein
MSKRLGSSGTISSSNLGLISEIILFVKSTFGVRTLICDPNNSKENYAMNFKLLLTAGILVLAASAGGETSPAATSDASSTTSTFSDFGSPSFNSSAGSDTFTTGQGPITSDAFSMSVTNGARNSLTSPLDVNTHFQSSQIPYNSTTSPFTSDTTTNSDTLSTTPQTDTVQRSQNQNSGLNNQTGTTSSATTVPNFDSGPAQTVPVYPSATGAGSSSGTAPINPTDAQ